MDKSRCRVEGERRLAASAGLAPAVLLLLWGRVPKTKPHLCTSTPGIQRPSLSGPEKGREIFLVIGHGGWEGQENFFQKIVPA